jgi:hypothetical protein
MARATQSGPCSGGYIFIPLHCKGTSSGITEDRCLLPFDARLVGIMSSLATGGTDSVDVQKDEVSVSGSHVPIVHENAAGATFTNIAAESPPYNTTGTIAGRAFGDETKRDYNKGDSFDLEVTGGNAFLTSRIWGIFAVRSHPLDDEAND